MRRTLAVVEWDRSAMPWVRGRGAPAERYRVTILECVFWATVVVKYMFRPGHGGGKIHVLGNGGGKISVLGHGGGEIRVPGHGGGKIRVLGHISKNSRPKLKDWFEKTNIRYSAYSVQRSIFDIEY